MCGIAGIVSSDPNKVTIERLKKMTDIIDYRGPDGDGHWINTGKNAGLGHRRLSIIDLSHEADQPMHYLGRYSIVFNGEIYNYLELKETLSKRGYTFTTSSDTEVLVAMYHREKEDCLKFLDGMFSFVIYDDEKREIFAARDRFGEKPFYYSYKPGEYFLFGSEMKCLWAAGVPKEVNAQMLYSYLAYGNLQNPVNDSETFYSKCSILPHGHYLKLSVTEISLLVKPYYSIDYTHVDLSISETQAQEKFRELFYTSVKRRLRSDVLLGSSLSGGLDSSLVVCVIDELTRGSGQKLHTFSAVFPGFIKDERKYIDQVVAQANLSPHFITPGDGDMIHDFDKLCRHQEEPFGSASIYAQYCVMGLARQNNVTVLLDGQGADEYLAGYDLYYAHFFNDLRANYPSLYQTQYDNYLNLQKDNTINPLNTGTRKGVKYYLRSAMPDVLLKPAKRFMGYYKHKRSSFFLDEFYAANHNSTVPQIELFKDLNTSLYHSLFHGSLQTLLRYADRNSMAHSREVRLPFLFHELVEFVFSLPPYFKINQGWTKWIMRSAFNNLLPKPISLRKDKIGYEPPQKQWLQNKNVTESIHESKRILYDSKIISKKEYASTIFSANTSEVSNKSWRLWMGGKLL
jgi:asparagine synthase (glutamine-hydrolysing)